MWSIGIYTGDSPFQLRAPANDPNPVVTAADVTDIPAEFVADPFMLHAGDRWHMFFEVLNRETQLGAIAFATLPLRELPDVDQPVVSVDTSYPGASAQVVETQITRVIEDQLSGIEGVDVINATSRDGRSSINIEFTLERDLEDAANDVRNAVSRARGNLPTGA